MHKNKKINIVLANSPIDDGNRGCVALTLSSLYFIDKVMEELDIKYELYILDTYLRAKKRCIINIEDRIIEFQPITYPYELEIKQFIKSLIYFKRTLKSLSVIKNADYILDIGRGDSFSDIYGKKRFWITDRIHKIARFFSVPYCLLPQTIGPFENVKIRKEACKSIDHASMVMARDESSYNYVKENVPKQKFVKEYIDLAFFLPYHKQRFDSSSINVGLNVSSLLWFGGYTGNNQFGLSCDYKDLVRTIINSFLKIDNVILYLVPHAIGKSNQIDGDTTVSLLLIKEYNNSRLKLSPYFAGPIEAKSFISGLDFFMGARMHSTIAAFSSGVPVVPMAYSRKFNGLFINTLHYNYMVDLKTEKKEEIVPKLLNAFELRKEIKKNILESNNIIATKEDSIFIGLKTFFKLTNDQ